MNTPIICHCLIGLPACGKSTLAEAWQKRDPNYVWVSTDNIRAALYGDSINQGQWSDVEAEVVQQIKAATTAGKSVIYDATNAKRNWRMSLLQKFADCNIQWIAWWFKAVSLEECKTHNQKRQRQVPEPVIEDMYKSLAAHPPIAAEGFEAVHEVPLLKANSNDVNWSQIEDLVKSLPVTRKQRQNRYAKTVLHPYSALLDFERLLYLIATLIKYPGIGELHQKSSITLKELGVENPEHISSEIDEIQAIIAQEYGELYADANAIRQDLSWLEINGLVNSPYSSQPLVLPDVSGPVNLAMHHPYSDRSAFERLIKILRFVAHHPFVYSSKVGSLEALVQEIEVQGVLAAAPEDSDTPEDLSKRYKRRSELQNLVRKDIQIALKPYKIMENKPHPKGYFLGTGIASKREILKIFEVLQANAKHLDDPVALDIYEVLRERVRYLQLDVTSVYPVRTILHRPIVDTDQISSSSPSLALSVNTGKLEDAIAQGITITLKRLNGTGRFPGEEDDLFQVLPLQIGFFDVGWYLGYKRLDNQLLRFERLDRLQIIPSEFIPRLEEQRLTEREQARRDLKKLLDASYGVHLGNDPKEQQKFLSKDANTRKQVEATLELWLTDYIFRFISAGTQRFPGRVKMSPRLPDAPSYSIEKKKVFTLKKTGNNQFPHRFEATLPLWVVREDVQFRRWILGFAGQVKVISPDFLAKKIFECGIDIYTNYKT